MKNLDESVKINHNRDWPHIPDHPYKILIIGGFRSEKPPMRHMPHWIWEIKSQISTKHFVFWRSMWIKVSITLQQKAKSRDSAFKKLKVLLLIIHKQFDDVCENWKDYNLTN